MDISAFVTMKNAANCENHCELQNHESVDFRTQPVPSGHVWFSASSTHSCACIAPAKAVAWQPGKAERLNSSKTTR